MRYHHHTIHSYSIWNFRQFNALPEFWYLFILWNLRFHELNRWTHIIIHLCFLTFWIMPESSFFLVGMYRLENESWPIHLPNWTNIFTTGDQKNCSDFETFSRLFAIAKNENPFQISGLRAFENGSSSRGVMGPYSVAPLYLLLVPSVRCRPMLNISFRHNLWMNGGWMILI